MLQNGQQPRCPSPTFSQKPSEARVSDQPVVESTKGFKAPPRKMFATASSVAGSFAQNAPQDPTLERLAASQKRSNMNTLDPELAALLANNSGFTRPANFSAAASACDKQIQAIDFQPALASGLVHPLVAGIAAKKPSLLHKHQGGWQTFRKQWEKHLVTLVACNKGNPIPDSILLEYFGGCLDESDQLFLENMTEKNPDLPFQEFWDSLAILYDRDTQAQLRLAWEGVRPPTGELNLEKWNIFQREWQLKRDRVEERTPQEEYKLLMRTLPTDWQRQVVHEEDKRGSRRFLVRMTGLEEKEPRVLKCLLEDLLQMEINQVTLIPTGAIIECKDLTTQAKILALTGHLYDGKPIRCSKVDPTLTADEVIQFIRRKLETNHKFQSRQQTWEEPSRVINAVQNNPPPQQFESGQQHKQQPQQQPQQQPKQQQSQQTPKKSTDHGKNNGGKGSQNQNQEAPASGDVYCGF